MLIKNRNARWEILSGVFNYFSYSGLFGCTGNSPFFVPKGFDEKDWQHDEDDRVDVLIADIARPRERANNEEISCMMEKKNFQNVSGGSDREAQDDGKNHEAAPIVRFLDE